MQRSSPSLLNLQNGMATGAADVGDIEAAIRHGIEAGRLRKYVRDNGETGLAGLMRLAGRHSTAAQFALDRVATGSGDNAPGRLPRALGAERVGTREG